MLRVSAAGRGPSRTVINDGNASKTRCESEDRRLSLSESEIRELDRSDALQPFAPSSDQGPSGRVVRSLKDLVFNRDGDDGPRSELLNDVEGTRTRENDDGRCVENEGIIHAPPRR